MKKNYMDAMIALSKLMVRESELISMGLFRAAEDVRQEMDRLGKIIDDYRIYRGDG